MKLKDPTLENLRLKALSALKNARYRCHNKKCPNFNNYGGRGIECRFQKWHELIDDIGLPPSVKHSLDRIDNNGHYERGNCRWATQQEQSNNSRMNKIISFRGCSDTIANWARKVGLSPKSLQTRLREGMTVEKALTSPLQKSKK